jgi:hypothetical protein
MMQSPSFFSTPVSRGTFLEFSLGNVWGDMTPVKFFFSEVA